MPRPIPIFLLAACLAASISACNAGLAGSTQPAETPTQPTTSDPSKATPAITWPKPAPITNPTPLTSAQLDATANVPGTFVYSPAAGTVLPAGAQTLTATFAPADTTDYNTAKASVTILVNADSNGSAPATHLAVADSENNRVLIYSAPLSTDESAIVAIGQPTLTEGLLNQGAANPSAASVNNPAGIAMDPSGNLWVADWSNCRVVEFQRPFTTGMNASLVLGQPDFEDTTLSPNALGICNNTSLPAPSSFDGPVGVAADAHGDIWVVDQGSRVMEFAPPFTNGMAASLVIGQPSLDDNYQCNGTSFTSDLDPPPPTAVALCFPSAAAFDAQGNLWVTDSNNNRVLEFVPPFSTGMAASLQLGNDAAATFGGNCYDWGGPQSAYITASTFCSPSALAFDGSGDLWVADYGYNRVLEFVPPLSNGLAASLVIGASSFTQPPQYQELPATANLFNGVDGLAFDGSGNLLVSDGGNSRVLIFAPPFADGMSATTVIGEPNMSSTSRGGSWECAAAAADTLCGGAGVLTF